MAFSRSRGDRLLLGRHEPQINKSLLTKLEIRSVTNGSDKGGLREETLASTKECVEPLNDAESPLILHATNKQQSRGIAGSFTQYALYITRELLTSKLIVPEVANMVKKRASKYA